MTINDRIFAFRNDIIQKDVSQLVQRHILQDECYALSSDAHFELKQVVASQFQVHPSAVAVVGSAKLGFSIAPHKTFRHFSETSDIDVVLASSELYDLFWVDVFNYWVRGDEWYNFHDFKKYHFRGWLRPDKLPPAQSFSRAKDWWEFFRELAASRKYGSIKISGALYKNWHFLEVYQRTCFQECKQAEMNQT